MEEVQCALLGFGSVSVNAASSTGGPSLSADLRQTLHPTEYAVVMNILPLGGLYATLQQFASDGAVGRLDGYVASATAVAVGEVLQAYEADVQNVEGIASLDELNKKYSESFHALVRMTRHVHEPAVFLLLAQQFLSSLDLPAATRCAVGERLGSTVLFCVAHYVAHGVVLEGRKKDFFILQQHRSLHDGTTAADADASSLAEEDNIEDRTMRTYEDVYLVQKRLLPCGITEELAQSVLLAGGARRSLKQQLKTSGATRLRDGARDENVAAAVFASIYNHSLTRGGRLVVEELEVRVEAARSIWSRALWALIGEERHLMNTVLLLRDTFLGHRGDLWGTFVDGSFPVICAGLQGPAGARGGGAAVPHVGASGKGIVAAVGHAYRSSLRATKLEDSPLGLLVSLGMDTPTPPTTHGAARLDEVADIILDRVKQLFLAVELSPGTELVIAKHTLDRYHELFLFQMTTRYAIQALHQARKTVQAWSSRTTRRSVSPHSEGEGGGDTRANRSASSSWRQLLPRVAALVHFFTFVATSVGHYFQVDVVEAQFRPLEEALQRNSKSVEEARLAHERFLLEVADAVFCLDDAGEALADALRSACRAALTLHCLIERSAATTGTPAPLSSSAESMTAIASLERLQQQLIVALASHLSTSSRHYERALWARLDFNRYFSNTWHQLTRPSAATKQQQQQLHGGGSGSGAAMPLSLGSLVGNRNGPIDQDGGGGAGTPPPPSTSSLHSSKLQTVAFGTTAGSARAVREF